VFRSLRLDLSQGIMDRLTNLGIIAPQYNRLHHSLLILVLLHGTMSRMKSLWPLVTILLLTFGCSQSRDTTSEAKFDPCDQLREVDPHCGWKPHWYHSEGRTNAIDGIKSEFLSLESTDADGESLGRLEYAKLTLCFENKKLCGHQTVGIGVTVGGMLQSLNYESNHSTPVRIKFDNEPAVRETWGIADDNDTLLPFHQEKRFFSQLVAHKKLILEFSYYEKAPRTITFELSGLSDALQADSLQAPH
jgi:hypothetical protein